MTGHCPTSPALSKSSTSSRSSHTAVRPKMKFVRNSNIADRLRVHTDSSTTLEGSRWRSSILRKWGWIGRLWRLSTEPTRKAVHHSTSTTFYLFRSNQKSWRLATSINSRTRTLILGPSSMIAKTSISRIIGYPNPRNTVEWLAAFLRLESEILIIANAAASRP